MGLLSRLLGRSTPPRRSGPTAAFFRRDSPFLAGWNPALRSARSDVAAAWRQSAARTIDALQNSGWITAAVNAATSATVGSGLQLNAKPSPRLFGGDLRRRDQWARETEAEFEIYAGDPRECDAEGRRTVGQMMVAGFRHWMATGEILGIITTISRPGTSYATKARMLAAWRLPLDTSEPDWIDGVRADRNGMPLAYRIRESAPFGQTIDRDVRARDETGRPIVIHVFDGDMETVRGISPFAPALRIVRQYDQLADATLVTPLLQTIFAATITSPNAPTAAFEALQTEGEGVAGTAEFEAWMTARQAWYENTRLDLGQHGRIVHLFPTEELSFHGAEHPSETYDPFSSGLLREIAASAGVSYEMMTGDYRNANFSSAQLGTAVIWPIVLYRRNHIIARLAGAIYEAWLEEAIASGRRPFPGGLDAFLANRAAAARADWRGPARPTPDALKTARAQEILLDRGVASLESICADYGEDWQEVADRRKRESEYYDELGLPDPHDPNQADRTAIDTMVANSD